MRTLKNRFYDMVYTLAISTTIRRSAMKKTKATGVLALANATTVKSGTQATDACNATKSVHVFGARKTTSIKSALISKERQDPCEMC